MARLAVERNEGVINSTGSLSVNTGKYTGRSPDDRFIVHDDKTRNTIDWGKINHQFPSGKFEKLFENCDFGAETHVRIKGGVHSTEFSKF